MAGLKFGLHATWILSLAVILALSAQLIECDPDSVTFDIAAVYIDAPAGPVYGSYLKTLLDEKPYYSFKGIPYAEAPVGELRYKPPVPKKKWTEPIDAFEHGSKCLQRPSIVNKVVGSEDCLFLNVYSADVTSVEGLDVMVYIHGGRFVEGSGNDEFHGPDFLMDKNVVLVTLNYRLGVLGFLSLGNAEYSGNMGLKDQRLAIEWVRQNIAAFGGNPKKITLFGQSAGAASTHLHMLTPTTPPLFARSILMSGTAVHTWAVNDLNDHVLSMFALAKVIEDPVYTLSDLEKFVQRLDGETLMKYQDRIPYLLGEQGLKINQFWGPVVENANAIQPFLQTSVEQLLGESIKQNTIETMFGFNSFEWLFQMGGMAAKEDFLKHLETNFKPDVPHKRITPDHPNYEQIATDVRQHYLAPDGRISNRTINELGRLLSDVVFAFYVDQVVHRYADSSPANTFYYRFGVDAKFNAYKVLYRATDLVGASHGDELCYIFRCNVYAKLYDGLDRKSVEGKTIEAMTSAWTDFAKIGKPTQSPDELPAATNTLFAYLNIENVGLSLGVDPQLDSTTFWNKLIAKYLDAAEKSTAESPEPSTNETKSKPKKGSAERVEL